MKAKKSESKFSSAKLSYLKKGFLAVALVIFALALTSGVASATTHVVNKTAACTTIGDYYYTSIQAAVWNASGGDAIIVCPETFQETVDVNKSDIIIKAHNETKPVVSADVQDDHVFNITDQMNVTLQGFEIRDAYGSPSSVAGIYMSNTNDSRFINNAIVNISGTGGTNKEYGIELMHSNNNSFTDMNISDIEGGDLAYGIKLYESNNNTFDPTVIDNVTAVNHSAYGIFLGEFSDNNNFSETSISDVEGNTSAYGIYVDQYADNNTFNPTVIENLTAVNDDAYGIYLYTSDDNNFTDNNISDVEGNESAYGIFLEDSDNNTFDPTVIENVTAVDEDACGIFLGGSDDNNFTDTSVRNVTAEQGDAYGTNLTYSNNNTFSNTSIYNIDPVADFDAYGIYLDESNENKFYNTSIENLIGPDYAYGIHLQESNNNTFDPTVIDNVTAVNHSAYGIYLYRSNSSNFTTTTISDVDTRGNLCDAYGVYLWYSNGNNFTTTTISDVSASGTAAYGIDLYCSGDNNFIATTISDVTSEFDPHDIAYGISLCGSSSVGSDRNIFDNGSFSRVSAREWWDFLLNQYTEDNVVTNFKKSSYPTNISFTCANGIKIKSVDTAPPDHSLKSNIGKYVNATNITADSWLFLNISYNASDVSGVQEDSLRLWKHNGTWHEVAGVNGVNTAENYVYANITDFSVFAPLGNSTRVTIPTATGTGNVTIETDKGYFCNETDALPASPPDPPALTFPHGFFNVTICGLNTSIAENVTINFTFPSAIPTNAEFWKYNSSNETWYPYPFDSNYGDNVISITITDNGAGDHNPALGVINDPNGIGWPAAAKVPALTPIGIIALVGLLSVIAAMSIRRRK